MTHELPATTTRRVYLVDLSGHGTTSDDETDVYADGEVGLAGEVDGDGCALVALAGSVAHDPEEVDAGAGEAGGGGCGVAGIQVLAGWCEGWMHGCGRGERRERTGWRKIWAKNGQDLNWTICRSGTKKDNSDRERGTMVQRNLQALSLPLWCQQEH